MHYAANFWSDQRNNNPFVMAGLVPAIHAVGQGMAAERDPTKIRGDVRAMPLPFLPVNRVDGRDKPGHDGDGLFATALAGFKPAFARARESPQRAVAQPMSEVRAVGLLAFP